MRLLLAAAAAAAVSYAPPAELGRFADPAIAESSGVAASAASDDVLFTHNDSGDEPRFFAVDTTGATLARFEVSGARAFDWEDMARGTDPDGTPTLFLGDIGDNIGQRRSIFVYVVREPSPLVDATVPVLRRVELRYEDEAQDAEALLVDPAGSIVVVTKGGVVYRAVDGTLRAAGEVRLDGAVTGGDVAPDGGRAVLRTLFDAFEWDVADGDVAASLVSGSPRRLPLPLAPQGEAVAYTRDGRSLVTTSEGVGAPLHVLRGRTTEGAASERPDRRGGVARRWWRPAVAVGVVVSLALSGLAGRRRRRRRRPRPPARPA